MLFSAKLTVNHSTICNTNKHLRMWLCSFSAKLIAVVYCTILGIGYSGNTVPSICKVLYQCCFLGVISMTSSAYCLHVLHLSYSFLLSSQHCSRMILYTLSSVIHPLKSSAFVSIISAWSTSSPELPSVCYRLLYNIALLRSHVMVGSWKRVWFAWMLLAKSTNVVPRSYWQLPLSARLLK